MPLRNGVRASRHIIRMKLPRIGIFGGSFDPPHVCHVLACAFALETGEIDRVLVVPAHRHPFGKAMQPFHHRVRMARLAMRVFGSRVKVSTLERDMAASGFTYDTVRALQRAHPEARFRLIVGSDVLRERRRWHRFGALTRMAPLLVVPRARRGRSGFALPDVSSTAIRRMLAADRDPRPLVPEAVIRYLERHRLYRDADRGRRS